MDLKLFIKWIDSIYWGDSMSLNIVIPMAGAGSRFIKAGFENPKPFIDLNGKPMIMHIIQNIAIPGAKYIFIAQKEHLKKFGAQFIENIKQTNIADFEILTVDKLTEGAACTLLFAKNYINNTDELLVVNSDQLVGDRDIINAVEYFEYQQSDGGILCFFNTDPKWSYVKINENRLITQVVEKTQISEHATIGIYHWSQGRKFVSAAEEMIKKNIRVNNEFYVAPTYNQMIMDGAKISPYFVNKMIPLGTPDDFQYYVTGRR